MVFLLFLLGLALVFIAIVIQCLPTSVRGLLPESSEDVKLPPLYLWSLLITILAFNIFAYDVDVVAVGSGVFIALLCVALWVALPAAKKTFFAHASTAIGVLAALAFAFRANEFVQAVNGTVAMLAIGALLLLHSVERIEWNAVWFLRTVLLYPAVLFQRLPGVMRLLRPTKKLSGISTLFRVVAITVVLVIFFSFILSSADPIFAQKIEILQEQIIPRTLSSVVLAFVMLIGLAAVFSKTYTYKALPLRFLSWIETAIPVSAVCVLFAVFLWVQGTYLFASHTMFQAFGFTYAEYVRRGMIEVLIATFCAGLLSYVVSLKERELTSARETGILQAVNVVLLVELFLMLGSALKRDWMYMDVYGLTRVRIVGEVFLVWLAAIVVLFAAFALWKRLNEKAVFAGAITVSFCVVAWLNIVNMDARIGSAVPPGDLRRDNYYLSLLSYDAVGPWGGAIEETAADFEKIRTKNVLTSEERTLLASMALSMQEIAAKRDTLTVEQNLLRSDVGEWTSFRWSEYHALNTMNEQATVYRDMLSCLNEEVADYRTIHQLELSEEISSLKYDYTRPFVEGSIVYDDFPYISARGDETVESCL